MRTLILDIETRPNLAYVWKLWKENIPTARLIEQGQVISFAAKWLGEKKVIFASDFHDGHEAMIRKAYELFEEADVIVHYNGTSFDVPHLNTEFALLGLPAPTSHRDVDLYRTVANRFRFPSNKLDYVAQQFGLGGKVKHSGFDLWVGAIANDPKAWAQMRRYNIGDTKLTEELYLVLLSWFKNHPLPGLYGGDSEACRCGSTDRMKRGFAYTPARRYQRWQCNVCGTYSRDKSPLPDNTTVRNAA